MSHAQKIQANSACGRNVDNNIVKVDLSTRDSFEHSPGRVFCTVYEVGGDLFQIEISFRFISSIFLSSSGSFSLSSFILFIEFRTVE